MTNEDERRQRALDFAVRTRTVGMTPDDVVVAAGKYYEFLTGKKENQ